MIEDQRNIILAALRAAEDHYHYCCGHCGGETLPDIIRVRDAIKALGEQTAEELREQEYQREVWSILMFSESMVSPLRNLFLSYGAQDIFPA